MLEVAGSGVIATIVSLGLAFFCCAFPPVHVRLAGRARLPATMVAGGRAGASATASLPPASGMPSVLPAGTPSLLRGGLDSRLADSGTLVARLGLVFLTGALIARTLATGHGPFANMYEFSIAFGWGILAAAAYFEHHYAERRILVVALPASTALLLYASTLSAAAAPLVPALQNNLLLTVHVACAVVAYGTLAVAFGAAVLWILGARSGPEQGGRHDTLDEISYRAVVVGFPFLTLTIALGAVWADLAWGSYWSWDPKETASLVTWFIYGAYLHARVVREWRGRRAAWLLVGGFAAILFTFLGNLFFGGLHAYSGLG